MTGHIQILSKHVEMECQSNIHGKGTTTIFKINARTHRYYSEGKICIHACVREARRVQSNVQYTYNTIMYNYKVAQIMYT